MLTCSPNVSLSVAIRARQRIVRPRGGHWQRDTTQGLWLILRVEIISRWMVVVAAVVFCKLRIIIIRPFVIPITRSSLSLLLLLLRALHLSPLKIHLVGNVCVTVSLYLSSPIHRSRCRMLVSYPKSIENTAVKTLIQGTEGQDI